VLPKKISYEKVTTPEVNVLTYPNETHMNFGASLLGLVFWMSRVLEFIFIVKIPSNTHCTHMLANERSRHISSQR
jgi:hypothetical protein